MKQHDWRDEIKIGDVLRTLSGDFRIVRSVSYRKGFLGCVSFVIRRRSWTNRAYTWVSRVDLKQRGFTPTSVRCTFVAGTIDAQIFRDLQYKNRFCQKLKPEDVEAVP